MDMLKTGVLGHDQIEVRTIVVVRLVHESSLGKPKV